MIDHLEDGCVSESNILFFEWRHSIVSDGIQDEFLSCLFDAQVVPVALLFDLVLCHELLSRRCCIACCEGVGRVRSWVGRYRVVQVALLMTSLYLLSGIALARWPYFCPCL